MVPHFGFAHLQRHAGKAGILDKGGRLARDLSGFNACDDACANPSLANSAKTRGSENV